MRTVAAIVTVAVVALYLYKSQPFPWSGETVKQEVATAQLDTAQNDQALKLADGTSAPRSTNIVVAPMPKVGWNIGPNAQTDLTPTINRLKTGPNAQTDLTPTINRLKIGPNAQTDLTMKRSW